MTAEAVAPLLWSREDVQRALGADASVVDELIASGRLPVVRLRPDGPPRFRVDDVLLLANAATADGLAL